METTFKKSRKIVAGGQGITRRIEIGGGAPVSLQTMWKSPLVTADGKPLSSQKLEEIASKITSLDAMGCDLLRFAVPDMNSAESLINLANMVTMPLVADIHFDYKLALRCLDGAVAKIRINPGNIGSEDKVRAVVEKAGERHAAIRIGVNAGSLPKDLAENVLSGVMTRSDAVTTAAEREIAVFDKIGFTNFAVSIKASTVQETIDANESFARRFAIPLHIGVTEAGPVVTGAVKSAIALHHLLSEGIGDTMRVSLSSDVENEVLAGRAILAEAGCRSGGVKLISCPRCGRMGFDVHQFTARWEHKLLACKKDVTVAVMGCVVNGPGEAKHADIGITGIGDKVFIFRKGEIVQTVSLKNADTAFEEELSKL